MGNTFGPKGFSIGSSRHVSWYQLGPHRIVCGDATDPAVFARLLEGDVPARLVLTDEPYNVKIAGNVTGGAHREFAMASGEMTDAEFLAFNEAWMAAVLPYLCDGGVFGTFIDWRGSPTVHSAAAKLGLVPLNLIVWAKTNAGMGSLYRSQHELLPLFKKGTAPHVNNVELGKRGRWRSNVWTYPGASSLGSDARRGLKDHPTVKPTAMLEDALLDLTNRGDIVIDPFLGSGSTLIAAEKTGRVCRGVELDPLYVDVIVRRYRGRDRQPGGSRRDRRDLRGAGAAPSKSSSADLGPDPERALGTISRLEAAAPSRRAGACSVEVRGSNPLSSTRKSVETTVVAPGPECLHPPPPNQGIIALICKDAVAIRTPNRTRRATRVSLR